MEQAPLSMAEIVREIHRLDPKCERHSLAFKAAACLLAGLQVGVVTENVAAFTGYSTKLVRKFSGRWRENGVWKRGKTCCEWFEEGHGVTAFWLDVNVALGYVERTRKPRTRKIKKADLYFGNAT